MKKAAVSAPESNGRYSDRYKTGAEKERREEMSFVPRPQEIYQHFKGNLYQVTAVAEHTETGEQLVIYHALYGDLKLYARPLSLFVSRVDRAKYPDAGQEFRFRLQGPEADRQIAESEPEIPDTGTSSDSSKTPDTGMSFPIQEAEAALDPMLLEFLDSDSYEQKLNILAGLHHRITDEMITTMAIACDIEMNDGETEERYESLKSCLLTLERYECNRLR